MDELDVSKDFDTLVNGMAWDDVVSTVEDVIAEMNAEEEAPLDPQMGLSPPPDTSAPAAAVPDLNRISNVPKADILSEGNAGYEPGSTALPYSEKCPYEAYVTPAAPLDNGPFCSAISSPDMYNHEVGYQPNQYYNVPVHGFPEYDQNVHPTGYLNGTPGTNTYVPPNYAASPSNMFLPNGYSTRTQLDDDRPYVKKPLNAFMIFRKEQRPLVMSETNIRDSAKINAIVGKKWKALTREEQAEYFTAAEKERILHSLKHPDWSFKHNYGKRKYRSRRSKKAMASVQKTQESCMTPSMAPLVQPRNTSAAMLLQHQQLYYGPPPEQPATQDQGMLMQHLHPFQSDLTLGQGYQDNSTVVC